MSNRTLNLNDNLYQYLLDANPEEGPILRELRAVTAQDKMARMQIAPEQGQFLKFLCKLIGARKALEVGTFTGYSALCIASALPADGKLHCCDVSETWTNIAKTYWRQANLHEKIHLTLAPAENTLRALIDQGEKSTYDFAFIDADKENYDTYFELCLTLLRSGGLILFDNVLWGGKVSDRREQDADTIALRRLNQKLKQEKRGDMCMIPVADGLTLFRKH